ncbi:hypothetical protein L1049_025505 [Liquidambar formosana]|uniref:GOLD domain-containing protein n=1 Tax=Liquidambar formosana TaxID=63359 RepID=A0AAP0NCZ7_LIQFO
MAGGVIARASATLAMWVVLICWESHLVPRAQAIWLTLPTSGTKCVSEEIQSNVIVLADYAVIDEHDDGDHHDRPTPTISARVTSPYGNNIHHQENVTHGQFALTTTEGGNYLACFWVDGNHQGGAGITVSLDWRIGIGAKDWESVARKEKIEGVELELRRLEGAVQAIHENLIYLKNREAEMREVSELTNGRVAWFSIMSLGVCIVVSALQLWYLKRFFERRNLSRFYVQIMFPRMELANVWRIKTMDRTHLSSLYRSYIFFPPFPTFPYSVGKYFNMDGWRFRFPQPSCQTRENYDCFVITGASDVTFVLKHFRSL